MADFTPIIEAFSLSHAAILDGTKSFLDSMALSDAATDIYGVAEGSLDPDTDSFDNEGDDGVLSNWAWLNFAKLSVKGGYISFPLIESLTGQVVTHSSTVGASPKAIVSVDLWHEDSMNVPPKPMILRMPAKDSTGNPADLVIGLYRVQFSPMTFDGPKYKDGLKIAYDGKALYSLYDEKGVAFPDGKKRVGRLLAVQR